MEEITNDMIETCLQFIQEQGGEISRYSFDRFVTKNIRIKESFNLVPKKLLEEELILIRRDDREIKIIITPTGIKKLSL
jgi:hypothetical protein